MITDKVCTFYTMLLNKLNFKSLKHMAGTIMFFQIILLSCLWQKSASATELSMVIGKTAAVTGVIGGADNNLKGHIVNSDFNRYISRSESIPNINSTKHETQSSTTMSSLHKSDRKINFRLTKSVVPKKYWIHLHPCLETGLFNGIVSITIEVLEETDVIILHAKKLNISGSSLIRVTEKEALPISIRDVETDDDNEVCMVNLVDSIHPGSYNLTLHYNGDMKNRIIGLYESVYKNTAGKERKIATSKFEPTYARQAFPCFDEPAMKAVYTVKLVTPPGYIALSNMNQVDAKKRDDGNSVIEFKESVEMSTYLVCFIICDFKHINETIKASVGKNFEMRVFAADGQLEKAAFSLEVGKKVTEYYIEYFNTEYPLPKLDMIAIPDFVSGAMEHWGLVTFKETNLLYDPETTSMANKQNIARVVAHEVSHMWFGNLVTMKWWDELWLNEGFASYMQYKALAEIYTDWKMLEQFLTSNSHSIYALDGTLSSHPIVQKVESPDEITTIFDGITYNKGAAVIRMLEGFVTEKTFRKGVQNYMDKYKFKNTGTQDFLNEIDDIFKHDNPNQNLTKIMDTWTRQTGLPLVTVAMSADNKSVILTQKRFLADPDAMPPTQENFRWHIPITYTTDKGVQPGIQWLTDDPDANLIIPLADAKYIKFNNDQVGYYRVNYPVDMWTKLNVALLSNGSSLTVSDKTHLLNDVFNLAEAGEVPFYVALDLSKYLENEVEYTPWVVASSQFASLKRIMSESLGFIEFKTYVRTLVNTIYEEIMWDPETTKSEAYDRLLLRPVILNLACSFGNEDCLSEVSKRFKAWLGDKNSTIIPDLKSTVYSYGIQASGETEWLKTWDRFLEEDDAQEKSILMHALAASTNPAILKRYLQLAWDPKNIRSQDHLAVIQYISLNPVGTPVVWDHVRENWPRLVQKFTINSRILGTTVSAITKSFASELKLNEMISFFTMYPNAGAGAVPREQAKENVKNNIKWLKKHDKAVTAWLTENNKNKS